MEGCFVREYIHLDCIIILSQMLDVVMNELVVSISNY